MLKLTILQLGVIIALSIGQGMLLMNMWHDKVTLRDYERDLQENDRKALLAAKKA